MPSLRTRQAYDRTALATVDALVDEAQAAADAALAAVEAIEVPPSSARTVTASGALTADDYMILADATGGAITLQLPNANAISTTITVKRIDASGNAVNVIATGADALNGSGSPVSIVTQYDQRTFVNDGVSEWYG
jgi:hypothetical protein